MGHRSYPTVDGVHVGWITERDMVDVDRIMIEDLHIELLQTIENAGRNLARLVLGPAAPTSRLGRLSPSSEPQLR
jgi:hypothetical protein